MDAIVGGSHYQSDYQRRWCQLPSLLIWMIKDKLSIIDNFHLSCVCKHWESSSLNYTPSKELSKQSVLWLLKKYRQYPPRPCEFVNLSTKEKLILDLPEINRQASRILYSKRGWLLIHHNTENSLVFLNPHSNTKITLPALPNEERPFKATFSVSQDDGHPQHVVFYNACTSGKPSVTTVSIYISAIDSEEWSKYSYDDSDKFWGISSLVVHRHKVYCLKSRQLLIFDMASLCWRKLEVYPSVSSRIMESEGDILKIAVAAGGKPYGGFSKLNDRETGWVELNDNEARTWFLRGNCQYGRHDFSVKVSGGIKRVHKIETKPSRGRPESTYVRIHDLACNSETLHEPVKYEEWKGDWVDLGWMHKLPPSCVCYIPSG